LRRLISKVLIYIFYLFVSWFHNIQVETKEGISYGKALGILLQAVMSRTLSGGAQVFLHSCGISLVVQV